MTTVLQLTELRKRYRRHDPWAVDGVSLRIEAGQIHGLLGPNGAGKSTIVKTIAGLLRPDHGTVRVLGSPPADPGTRAVLGFAAEEPDFPKFLRAAEVLDYYGRLLGLTSAQRRQRIPETLEWCGLAGERRHVRHFSKGMKQRLGLGQAILGRPRLLILDEPTADLDPLGRRDVRDLVLRLRAGGAAILLNSHLLSEVERVSDTVTILDHGHVLAEGGVDEVVADGQSLEEVFMKLVVAADHGKDRSSVPTFVADGRQGSR
jgi:ABC-2 type transport system ATP-binding protein